MAERQAQTGSNTTAIIFAVFALACLGAFLVLRGSDVGQLPKLVGDLGAGPLVGSGIFDALVGALVAVCILSAWAGLGRLITRVLPPSETGSLQMLLSVGIGAAAWSLIWFLVGVAGGYSTILALIAIATGVPTALFFRRWTRDGEPGRTRTDTVLMCGIVAIVVITLVAAVAPTTAKDALLYHFALPKTFASNGSNLFVDGNIASYLALGTEMHATWAMLIGGIVSPRAGEAAAGATVFLFFPLLLLAMYGWARETGTSKTWSLIATVIVACIPTAYHVASSGYIDLSLALYVTLATYALTRWWKEQTSGWAILIAIFLGAALSVKLTAVFVFAVFALIVLLARNPVTIVRGSDTRAALTSVRIVLTGFTALLLAGVVASPWYVRAWLATGSPVFPFYMSIWPGHANGWDVERSNLFQGMNSQYGGADVNKLNYLTAPVRVSVAAQPEQPVNYDGVLGPAFLIGTPLLIYALWKLELAVEIKIMAGVAAVMYLFWLFSSVQLRYLLPIVPLVAIAIVASAERIGGRVAKVAQLSLVAASVCGLLTIFAWFARQAPSRVVLGGERRDEYLARNLDYYPYYQEINKTVPADAKVWLINMRRDTYHIERPVVSDYLFEDWTLRKMLWEARSQQELKAKVESLGVQFILTRHDFLFDYDRSTLVDDKRSRAENEAKLAMAKELVLDPARTLKADDKFSLVKLY